MNHYSWETPLVNFVNISVLFYQCIHVIIWHSVFSRLVINDNKAMIKSSIFFILSSSCTGKCFGRIHFWMHVYILLTNVLNWLKIQFAEFTAKWIMIEHALLILARQFGVVDHCAGLTCERFADSTPVGRRSRGNILIFKTYFR